MSRESVERFRLEADLVDDPETRARMLSHCDWQERVDEAAEGLPEPPPSCPSWCELSAGHEYDSVSHEEPFIFSRYHYLTVDGGYVAQEEQVDELNMVGRNAPFARLSFDEDDEKLDAARLRKSAAAALNMADMLDEITPTSG